jgi:uncharacterized protein YkwD
MTRRLTLTLACIVALAVGSCGGGGGGGWVLASAPYATPNAGNGGGNNPAEEGFAHDGAEWINGHRVANGLAPCTWNAGLAAAALFHSNDMDLNNLMQHTIGASTLATRLTAAGVVYTTAGENIARGQTTGKQVAESWMYSDGHRANILNGNFVKFAVAYANLVNPGPWWTNVFSAP